MRFHIDWLEQNPALISQSVPAPTSLVSGHLGLQVLGGHVELGVLVHGGLRFTLAAAAVAAAAQTAAEVAAGGQAAEDEQRLRTGRDTASAPRRRPGSGMGGGSCRRRVATHLSPPAGQDKVGVDVLLAELLGHVEPQRAVLVVDVLLGGVAQDGVGVVDLLELLSGFRVVGVLVRVKLQRHFPEKNTPTHLKRRLKDEKRQIFFHLYLAGAQNSVGKYDLK